MSVTVLSVRNAGRTARRLLGGLLLAFTTLMGVSFPAHASEFGAGEEEAVHLQRFIGYIEWPANAFMTPTAAIVVGIAGSDSTFNALSRLVAGKPAHGRHIQVRRLERPEQMAGMHLAYVGRDAWPQFQDWRDVSLRHAVVLVTNAPDGTARGATLGLIQSTQRTRFEASLPAASQVGVKLSARLLEVAERVVGAPR